MPRLEGSRVVIVGGSSGIGLATAKRVVEEGAAAVIVGRSPDRLREAEQVLGRVDARVADVADPDAIARAFDGLAKVDHVFLSAGGPVGGPVLHSDVNSWRGGVEERLFGALHVVREARPRMTSGSITFTSGSFGSRPMPGAAMAAALSGAIEGLTRALALELSPVRVNAIAPGPVDTPLLRSVLGPDPDGMLQGMAGALPARRVGRPEEIADAVVMVMANPFMTGEVLHIDGGARIG